MKDNDIFVFWFRSNGRLKLLVRKLKKWASSRLDVVVSCIRLCWGSGPLVCTVRNMMPLCDV
jgi:hypothetical protein